MRDYIYCIYLCNIGPIDDLDVLLLVCGWNQSIVRDYIYARSNYCGVE